MLKEQSNPQRRSHYPSQGWARFLRMPHYMSILLLIAGALLTALSKLDT
jgi:hypothetical protein